MTGGSQGDAYQKRLDAIRGRFRQWGVGAVLITCFSNRRWLSGFTGSAGQLLVTADEAVLATDFRYWDQAALQAPACRLFRQQRRNNDVEKLVACADTDRIGIEAAHVTLAHSKALRALKHVEWIELDNTAEPMRMVKDAMEIGLVRAAAAATDTAMSQVPQLARPGMSERALAWELEKAMREAGADHVAFAPIVASGPNSALPHHQPGERALQPGDIVVVDLGSEIGGYRSDLTRTFYLGGDPPEQFWRIYHLVEAAQAAALEHARPGMDARQVDALARDLIVAAGHGEHFGHGLGHGVGLDVHEEPFLTARPAAAETIVPAGSVVTIEPGVYLPGWGGIRLEDLVHFSENGPELMSHFPKSPVIAVEGESA